MSKVSSAAEDHKHHSPKSLRLIVITVSTSRYRNKSLHDESGEIAVELCRHAGHKVSYKVVDDDKQMIRIQLLKALFEGAKDGAILSGGTGLSTRDVTIEAVQPLLDKTLEGFGEIFRRLSFDTIGSPALMSRALAGLIQDKPVFCLPGSPDAAQTGVEIALKELPHAAFIARSKPKP